MTVAALLVILFLVNRHTIKQKNLRIEDSDLFARRLIQGQEDERQRLARELHDTTAQNFYYILLLASKIQDKELREQISQNQQKCIEEIRAMCQTLSPSEITSLTFADKLNELCSQFMAETQIETRLAFSNAE